MEQKAGKAAMAALFKFKASRFSTPKMKVNFEVHESHLPLWERDEWRYAVIMGGRGNGRSGTASRYVMSRLLGKEYIRGADQARQLGMVRKL